MRILLVGEFSRLHNSLKEGLLSLGHDVVLVNNGDGFKNYPADISIKAAFFKSKIGNIARQIWFKIFKFDLALLEHGIRFWWHLSKFKDFDVVQFINEKPIQTQENLEFHLIKKLFKQNKKIVLLCCGVDYITLQHMLAKKERYSIMNPYFEGIEAAKKQYDFMFDYLTKTHIKIHEYIYQNCFGVIASDLDYVNPLKDNPKYLGLVPNPIHIALHSYKENKINEKIIIFLGINTGNSYKKGIHIFEKALDQIHENYGSKVEISITRDIPYTTYIKHFEKANIVLDQVYGYDQGYNALEAMAKGKVVFTGADQEFLDYYNLQENEVAINALPDVNDLVEKLTFLIENPEEISRIGHNARKFIECEHDIEKCTKMYVEKWGN